MIPPTSSDPTRIGPCTVTARIDSGGRGVVYLGHAADGSPEQEEETDPARTDPGTDRHVDPRAPGCPSVDPTDGAGGDDTEDGDPEREEDTSDLGTEGDAEDGGVRPAQRERSRSPPLAGARYDSRGRKPVDSPTRPRLSCQ